MKILIIILKEFVEGIRDTKTMILMVIMPTILTIILGMALDKSNVGDYDLSNIEVSYYINESSNEEINIINALIESLKKQNISCENLDDNNVSRKNTIMLEFYGLKDIRVTYYNKYKIQGEIIKNILENFIESNKLNLILEKENVSINNKYINKNYVVLSSITGENTTSALNYYGITMVVITIMFSSVTGAYKIIKEKSSGTLKKIRTTPISTRKLLIGKLFGSLIVVFFQVAITMLISKYMLKVNWGYSKGYILIILLCEGIFAISIGIFTGVILEDNKSAWLILLAVIMSLGFFSGSFFSLGQINNRFMLFLTNLNPLKAENIAIFNYIYDGSINLIIQVCSLYICISFILIVISSIIMEEIK